MLNSIAEYEITMQFIHKMDGLIMHEGKILRVLEAFHNNLSANNDQKQ